MRRSLPVPDGLREVTNSIQVSTFTAADTDGLLAVNNRAFAWHPDQGGWDLARLEERMAEPWFDPGDLLVHHAEQATANLSPGDVDGFCWTKVHELAGAGEIFVICADPDTHGTGLGRALTVAGLDHLAEKGLTHALLYVEADNTPAIALYERLGMSVHHSDAGYAQIRPAAQP